MSDTKTINQMDAINALLAQLRQWKHNGAHEINFGALASSDLVPDGVTVGELIDVATESTWTESGFSPLWIAAINGVLSDRDTGIKIVDIDQALWDEFIGPMCDEIEDNPERYQ
jgi:hypothetical protein